MKSEACDFLQQRVWAVVGASNNPEKYGFRIYKLLDRYGYTVYPVNPREKEIAGRQCYASLAALPVKPDVVDLVVPPFAAAEVVKECARLGINKVWFQPGVDDENVISATRQLGLNFVNNACAMVESSKRYMLACKAWAIIGDGQTNAAADIADFLHNKGYTTHLIQPKPGTAALSELPAQPGMLAIVADQLLAESVLQECRERGIEYVWLQSGYESDALINLALSLQLTVVHHASILSEYSSVKACA
jgi:predicted CoA-binding protein